MKNIRLQAKQFKNFFFTSLCCVMFTAKIFSAQNTISAQNSTRTVQATSNVNPHVIFLSIKDYPLSDEQKQTHAFSGIWIAYCGYLGATDNNGTVAFKRSHQKPILNLLLCNNIQPIFMLKNTIAYWQITDKAPYAFYSIARMQDAQTKKFLWNIQKKELPDEKIPVDALCILTHPDEIFVPTGVVRTTNNSNLIIPELYVKQSVNNARNTLAVLEIQQFFEHIQHIKKIEGDASVKSNN